MKPWPVLSYAEAKETYQTLHLFTQVVGKIKMSKLPWLNHGWHVTLFVTPIGLTTGHLPDRNHHFQIDFDFIEHNLKVSTEKGLTYQIGLSNISVAEFYKHLFEVLQSLDIAAKINTMPNELLDPLPFDHDYTHSTYNPAYVSALHTALLNINSVLTKFRAEFRGKASPVHLYWGSFDLVVTRFSGREAPKHPGGIPNLPDWVAQEAYSHEVSSCGFWPGNDMLPEPAFYAYAYPEPEGFKEAKIEPDKAYYHPELREFILPYEIVQKSKIPEQTLLDFLRSTYNASADLAKWDRKTLE